MADRKIVQPPQLIVLDTSLRIQEIVLLYQNNLWSLTIEDLRGVKGNRNRLLKLLEIKKKIGRAQV